MNIRHMYDYYLSIGKINRYSDNNQIISSLMQQSVKSLKRIFITLLISASMTALVLKFPSVWGVMVVVTSKFILISLYISYMAREMEIDTYIKHEILLVEHLDVVYDDITTK